MRFAGPHGIGIRELISASGEATAVVRLASRVLGKETTAWLVEENVSLGSRPIDLLGVPDGRRQLINELERERARQQPLEF